MVTALTKTGIDKMNKIGVQRDILSTPSSLEKMRDTKFNFYSFENIRKFIKS